MAVERNLADERERVLAVPAGALAREPTRAMAREPAAAAIVVAQEGLGPPEVFAHEPREGRAGWEASLDLEFAARGARTILARRASVGPLVVQRPFYPEGGVAHVYLVHPPGGVVGGDQLRLRVVAEEGAHALLTTPAATKFYRSDGRVARQRQEIVADGATVE